MASSLPMVKRALIFVAIPTHFREMIRVGRLLKASGRYEPTFFFSTEYRGWKDDAALCRKEGIEVHLAFSDASGPAAAPMPGPTSRLPSAIRPMVQRVWRRIYARYWLFRFQYGPTVAGVLVGSVLLLLSAWMWVFGRGARANGDPRSTKLGRLLAASFGTLWETESKALPRSLKNRKRFLQELPALFQEKRIDLLVLPEDNYFLQTHFFVKAAHSVGAACVIVPFSVTNCLEWAETFHGRLLYSVRWLPNAVMARAFPHWTYEHKEERMIMPAMEVLMNEHLGLTPPNPWLINSGYADALAAESPFMVRYYREAGIEADKIVLTGALADDVLNERLKLADVEKERLYSNLRLPPGRPMLLFSVPPDQLIGDGRPQCEFRVFGSLLETVLSVLCRNREWNVVVTFHPRLDAKYWEVVDGFPVKLADENIAQLVPLCDVFVASASATIRLAAGAGKPTINYDVYRYEYTDFLDIPGVVTVSDLGAFEQAVDRITRDDEYRESLAARQRDFARQHALVDGRSGERMLALFDRLTASTPASRAAAGAT